MAVGATADGDAARGRPLLERKLWIPQMSWGGAMAFAAAFRSLAIDAQICPDGDAETLELGSSHTSGEECLPARVTLGGFLKAMRMPGFIPGETALFMPTADGPCRFGQYAPYIRKVLRDLGLGDVLVFSPSSRDGYREIGAHAQALMRNAFRGLVCADLLRKMLHRVRPYEVHRGDADEVHARAIRTVAGVLECRGIALGTRLRQLEDALRVARDEFRRLSVRFTERPLIGVVGEIACRLTPFMNDDVIRNIEERGGECTLAHIVEWVSYTNCEHQTRLRQQGRRFSKAMLAAKVASYIQHRDEHRLSRIFASELRGYEEPSVETVLRYAEPYLPSAGSLGEMTLSVGKSVFHYRQGCDGVVDIAPFSCMNGIVTEAVYPRVSADCDDMPIRNLFFDGTGTSLGHTLDVFMELTRSYQARKKVERAHARGQIEFAASAARNARSAS
jgi:predicted nucleotide-binding protein (sugar kinase/HSP70/actin superfamily)